MIRKFTLLVGMALISQLAMAQTVIWGNNPGEGDFDGGFNGWTTAIENVDTDSTWQWSPDGDASIGSFSAATDQIGSPTASNGAAMIHYDALTTYPGAPDPVFPYPDMITHLISPSIDISGAPSEFIAVNFYQAFRRLNPAPGVPISSVSFSNDGGLNWLPEGGIDCNPTAAANDASTINQVNINIPTDLVDLNAPLQVRFSWSGDFYFWAVDDVTLVVRPSYELRANDFYSITPNLVTPEGQMFPAGFLIDVENTGSSSMDNVDAMFRIEDAAGTSVYDNTLSYGTLTADSLAENQPFPGAFPNDLSQGAYTGIYTVSGDSTEANPDDNEQSFDFIISDSTFSKDIGVTRGISPARANWDAGENWTWAYGNHYLVPNGADKFARTLSFVLDVEAGTDTDITGQFLFIKLYEWIEEGDYDGLASTTEKVELGSAIYEVQADDGLNKVITVDLRQPDGTLAAIPLKDNGSYLAMVEYRSNDETNTLSMGGARTASYGARIFQDQFTDSTLTNYASVLIIGDELDTGDYSAIGTFGATLVPIVRLNIGDEALLPSSVKLPALADNSMLISPNPAVDFVNVALDLEEMAKGAILEIMDINGKTYNMIDMNNVQQESKSFQIEGLGSGTYYMRLTTEKGRITKPFQVIK